MERLHPPSLCELWRDKQAHRNVFSEDVKKSLRLLSEERLSPREVKTCVFVIFFARNSGKKNGVGEGTRTLDLLGHNQAL